MTKTLYLKVTDPQKDRETIRRAARLLQEGALVAFPTETVYGLGANALDRQAVEAIYAAKGRPLDNPMIVHIAALKELGRVCRTVSPLARTLADRFWPGPLTLVLPAGNAILSVVTGGLATVAVRIPDHPVALALLQEAGVPVAAPSANRSGRPSPTRAEHVLEDLEGQIAALVDGGPCPVGVESTVLDMSGPVPRILRPGGVSLEALREVLPEVMPPRDGPLLRGETPASPGMKYRHYAPRAPLYLLEGKEQAVRRELIRLCRRYRLQGLKVGLLTAAPFEAVDGSLALDLGGRKDPGAAASLLFAALRQMDAAGVEVILAEGIPEEGLGLAVMNRLRKAAGENILLCD